MWKLDKRFSLYSGLNFSKQRRKKNNEKIGKTYEVIIEGWDDYIKCYFGRTTADAPEIDGKIFFMAEKPLVIGEFVNVLVTDSIEYDLLGEAIL